MPAKLQILQIRALTDWYLYFQMEMVSKHPLLTLLRYISLRCPHITEAIVAESVIVIKRLLQTKAADPKEIVRHMTKLLDTIMVPNARAAILWLLGEHAAIVPLIAPDILRKMAKCFPEEQGIVKLQVLNLAVKLYIRNEKQTKILCKYIFTLARYDQDYDIRDRARLLKPFTEDTKLHTLSSRIEEIFLAPKPAPLLQSHFKDREDLQLGSLSHFINMRAIGYEPLPPFPEIPPPGDVRDVEPIAEEVKPKSTVSRPIKARYLENVAIYFRKRNRSPGFRAAPLPALTSPILADPPRA